MNQTKERTTTESLTLKEHAAIQHLRNLLKTTPNAFSESFIGTGVMVLLKAYDANREPQS